MNTDHPEGDEPERRLTRIDGVHARLLVHIERLDSDGAPDDSPNDGSLEDPSDTGIVTDAHPRIGGESEI